MVVVVNVDGSKRAAGNVATTLSWSPAVTGTSSGQPLGTSAGKVLAG